jgi:NAD-dependent DNA ligase
MTNEELIELISRRRRQILVHSAIYYRFDSSVIEDLTYDKWSNELADLQRKHLEQAKAAIYAAEFEEFDGSTGFDLPHAYPEIVNTAIRIMRVHKERRA